MSTETSLQKRTPGSLHPAGSAPASNREYDWVDDPSNQFFRYLIAPTVKRMQAIDARKLTIEIRAGKILFEMLPEEGASDVRQPEQNIRIS
jgi:hypothetical protein